MWTEMRRRRWKVVQEVLTAVIKGNRLETGGFHWSSNPCYFLSQPPRYDQFARLLPREEPQHFSFCSDKKKKNWSMITQTGSDKLDLAPSVLGTRDPYDECHFLQIEKQQREGKWWESWERVDTECLSNQSWIGIWLQHWFLSLW